MKLKLKTKEQRKKDYLNWSINMEIGFLWSRESFEGKYVIGFIIPIKFPSKIKKNIKIGSTKLYLKMPKSSCLKWTYGRHGIDYRVASLFKRYLTANLVIIPESFKSLGQF